MTCRATQDELVIVKSSDKMWSSGGGNGKQSQYYCCENHMNSMKRQNDMTPKHEPLKIRWYATGEEQMAITNSSRENEVTGPKWKSDTQLWVCLVVKVKSNAVKNNIA